MPTHYARRRRFPMRKSPIIIGLCRWKSARDQHALADQLGLFGVPAFVGQKVDITAQRFSICCKEFVRGNPDD